MLSSYPKWIISCIVVAAATRLLPHPPNFTALGGLALFCGAVIRRPTLAVLAPLLAMLLGDVVLLGGLYGFEQFPHVLPSYVCMALTALLGRALRTPSFARVGLGATLATLLFFVGTNFAVWWTGILYPTTWTGLVACYTAAIPFALNMLAANVVFSFALFFGYGWVCRRLDAAGASTTT